MHDAQAAAGELMVSMRIVARQIIANPWPAENTSNATPTP
jgi:hypothetical protein